MRDKFKICPICLTRTTKYYVCQECAKLLPQDFAHTDWFRAMRADAVRWQRSEERQTRIVEKLESETK